MSRRIWLVAVVVILAIGGLLLARARRSPFREWPRYVSSPGVVARTESTRVLVLDEHGRPASGAEVHFSVSEKRADVSSADAQGVVTLPTPDVTQLYATRGALASRIAWIGPELPKEGVVLRLGEAASLEVVVRDDEGHPVPNATLRLDGTFDLLSGMTDDAGTWHVDALPASVATVYVNADDRRAFQHVALLPGRAVQVVVSLEPTCELAGLVLFGGLPVPDAGVALEGLVDGQRMLEGRTDDRGTFAFTVRDSASFSMRVDVDGLLTRRVAVPPGCAMPIVEMRRGFRVALEVVDSVGHALPFANLKLRPLTWTGSSWHHEVQADAVGLALTGALSTEPWVAEATFGGATFSEQIERPEDAGRAVVRAPFQTRRIEGRVVDAVTGQPVPNANVAGVTTTAADGAFSYVGIVSSSERVIVWAPGYATRGLDSKAGEPLTFRLERRDWTIGRVLDGQGRPVPTFELDGERFFTADGRFVLGSNESRVKVRAWGFAPRELELAAHDVGEVRLEPIAPLEVHAFGPDGGPIAADLLQLAEATPTVITALRSGKVQRLGSTDQHGRAFVLPEDGCVFAASYPLLPSDCVDRDGGVLELRLGLAAAIEGMVAARDGGLVVSRRVEVDDGEAATFTDDEGRYRMHPITPGTRQVTANLESGMLRQQEVVLRPGETTRVDFQEGGGGQLTVRISSHSPGAVQIVVQGDGITTLATRRADERGEIVLELSGLGIGLNTIKIGQGDRRAEAKTFVSTTTHEVKLDLPRP